METNTSVKNSLAFKIVLSVLGLIVVAVWVFAANELLLYRSDNLLLGKITETDSTVNYTESDNTGLENTEAESTPVASEDAEIADSEDQVADTSEVEAETEAPIVYEINDNNVADYGNEQILDYTRYNTYADSKVPNFSFAYPASIFNSMVEDTSRSEGCYGTIIKTVSFSGSDGSYVNFTLSQRNDSRSIAEMTQYVSDFEKGFFFSPVDIVNTSMDDRGKVIFSGFVDSSMSSTVYNLTQIENNYVLQMKLYYPTPHSQDDIDHINYYIDTMYRMCGFSGSSNSPRSYTEFVQK